MVVLKKNKVVMAKGKMTRPQLLEGFKEESQVEDSGKKEGVGARSLTCSTRGVEGRARAPGLGLGRMTSLIHLLEHAHSGAPWC
jgi:hypothetical protein